MDYECIPVSVTISGTLSFTWSTGTMKEVVVDGTPNISVESTGRSGTLRFRLELRGRLAGLINSYEFDVATGSTYTSPITLYGGSSSTQTGDDFSVEYSIINNGGFETVNDNLSLSGTTHRYN